MPSSPTPGTALSSLSYTYPGGTIIKNNRTGAKSLLAYWVPVAIRVALPMSSDLFLTQNMTGKALLWPSFWISGRRSTERPSTLIKATVMITQSLNSCWGWSNSKS